MNIPKGLEKLARGSGRLSLADHTVQLYHYEPGPDEPDVTKGFYDCLGNCLGRW